MKNTKNITPDISLSRDDLMLDSRYIKSSGKVIKDALQKGFDVLQMENGDIVTTGTKVVVYRYTWSNEQGKLIKTANEKKDPSVSELVTESILEGA